jgi:magnesium-transporting ATPase (P-type)
LNFDLIVSFLDGSNDCIAFRKADIGLSLGQQESSLAADFTSATNNLNSVIFLLW